MKVCILDSSNFVDFPMGGQLSYLKDLLQYMAVGNSDIALVGISTDPKERVGEWSWRLFNKRRIPFMPLHYMNALNTPKRPLIPARLKLLVYVMLNRNKIRDAILGVLYVHAPELLLPCLFPKRSRIVVHTHGLWENTFRFSRYRWVRYFYVSEIFRKFMRYVLSRVDDVVVVNRESYNTYSQLLTDTNTKVTLVPTAVDTSLFRPFNKVAVRKHYGFSTSDRIIMYVGRLSWNKGLEFLLKSFSFLLSELPTAKLVLLGDGEMRCELLDMARESGIMKNTIFFGQHERSELPKIISCADVSTITSYAEGMPMAVLESIACGVPVVSLDLGDIKNVVRDGYSGFIVKKYDVQCFKNTLVACIRKSDSMKINCLKVINDYSIGENAARICNILLNQGNTTNSAL